MSTSTSTSTSTSLPMYADCATPIAEKRQRGWDCPPPDAPRKKQRPPSPSIMESPFARLTTIPSALSALSVRLFPPAVTLRLTYVVDEDWIRAELIVNE